MVLGYGEGICGEECECESDCFDWEVGVGCGEFGCVVGGDVDVCLFEKCVVGCVYCDLMCFECGVGGDCYGDCFGGGEGFVIDLDWVGVYLDGCFCVRGFCVYCYGDLLVGGCDCWIDCDVVVVVVD